MTGRPRGVRTGLTRAEVLDVIVSFTQEFGHPPSVRDIMPRVGIASTNTVHHHTRKLIEAGLAKSCECGCGRVKAA